MSQEIFANQSGSYSAELTRRAMFAQYARTAANSPGIIAGGIVGTGDLALSAPGAGMSVNVAPGECIVGGNSGGAQGGYYGRNTAQANLAVTAANATNPRVDTVVATVADALYGQPSDVGATTNGLVLAVVTGTPTAGATLVNLTGAAAVPLSSLVLGYVLVPASSTNVTAGNLATIAPIVADGNTLVTGTDAAKPTATAGNKGQLYEGTDSLALYLSDGSALRTVYGSRGAVNIATSQSTSSTTYTTLATPDQVTGIVLPADGVILVVYKALWSVATAVNGLAGLFLNSTQVTVGGAGAPANVETVANGTVNSGHLVSDPVKGLAGMANTGTASTDVTTGQLVAAGATGAGTGSSQPPGGGVAVIFANAGTYAVSVRYRVSIGTGTVTASSRHLWAMALPFS